MPELPEVETVRRALLPHLVGARIEKVRVRDTRLRVPVDARALGRALRGRRVTDIRRRAKYLLCDIEGDAILMLHLGMSGSLALVPAHRPLLKHDHVLFRLDGDRELRFNDPRRFGVVETLSAAAQADHPRLVHLGVEPLERSFSAAVIHAATRRSRRPIKSFLMDATKIVGVGNIYACEALHRAGVHPGTAVGRLSKERWQQIVEAVRATLREAVQQGGTTLRDYRGVDGVNSDVGYFAQRLRVYGRQGEPCRRCKTPIRRVVTTGRSTFYCSRCQRR